MNVITYVYSFMIFFQMLQSFKSVTITLACHWASQYECNEFIHLILNNKRLNNVTVLFSVDVFYIDEQKLCLKITLG